jgi:hypothetical protein
LGIVGYWVLSAYMNFTCDIFQFYCCDYLGDNLNFFVLVIYRTKMVKRCSKRRGARMHRRTRRGGTIYQGQGGIAGDMFRVGGGSKVGGGRKRMMRTRRRTRRGGMSGLPPARHLR